MNADDAENKPVASKYDVRSFPTIKFFPKGSDKTPIPYNLGRTEEQFVEVSSFVTPYCALPDNQYLNEQCGTHRTTAGLLSDTAGKVLTLDFFAQQFFSAGSDDRPDLLKKAKAYIGTLGEQADKTVNTSADYYVKAMERVLSKGESWLVKEQTRSVDNDLCDGTLPDN